jgi:GDP-L-fucose synthase
MDISLARELIDYNPTTSLLEGLKETWQWFLNNSDEYTRRKNYFAE